MEVYAGLFQQEMLADVDLVLRAEARTSSAAPPPAAAAGEQAVGAEAAGEQAGGAEAAGEQAAGAAAAGEQAVPAAPSEQPALAAAADTAPAADAASAEQPAAHAAGIEPAAAVAATAQQQPPGAAAADQQPVPAGTAVQQQQQQPADAAAPDEQPRSGGDAPPSKRQRLDAEAAAVAATTELARFPAHRLILWRSEYFRCQIERWQLGDGASSSSSSSSSSRPQLALTLARPDQHAAATAVLAAMYGVRGALGQLEHAQLVDAVLLADMLQAPDTVQQAVDALKAAAGSKAGLSAAAHAALSGLTAWPSCLAPLLPAAARRWCRVSRPGGDAAAVLAAPGASALQRVLLAALGDLERVWADEQLTKQLLALPLPAMQLLLASDELQVASEDTVLYTAECYADEQPAGEQQAAACKRLAVLVRAPQLSRHALARTALAEEAEEWLLGAHVPALKRLVLLVLLKATREHIQEELPDAPSAWHLGPRRIRPLPDGVQLLWRLPVAELAAACRRCAEERKAVDLFSSVRTPPLGGLAWRLAVGCDWQEEGDGGCVVDAFCGPVDAPRGVYYKVEFSVSSGDIDMHVTSPAMEGRSSWGTGDFFGVGAMRGGWDAAAWAAQGWPAEGEHLELRLTVHEVF